MYISKIYVENRANAALEVVGTTDILRKVMSTLATLNNVNQRTLWCCDIAVTKLLVDHWAACDEIDNHVAMKRMLDEQTNGFKSFYPDDVKFNTSDFNYW